MSEPFETKKHITLEAADFLGLSVRPLLRTRIGDQRLGLPRIVACFGYMFLLNAVANFQVSVPIIGHLGAHTRSEALRTYGFFFLAMALYQRHARRKEFRSGVEWHGQHPGVSHFEFLGHFVPREWIYRYVDGGMCFLAGYVVFHLGFSALGICLIFGAIGFAITEAVTLEAEEERRRILRNQNLDAANLSATMGSRNTPPTSNWRAQSASAPSAAVPTGLDDRLARDIRSRGHAGRAPVEEPVPAPNASAHLPGPVSERAAKIKLAVAGVIVALAVAFYNFAPPRVVEQVKRPISKALTPIRDKVMVSPSPAPAQIPVRPRNPFFTAPQPVQPDTRPLHEVLGRWQVYNIALPRGICFSRAEVASDALNMFTAFVTLGCRAASPAPQRTRGRRTPVKQTAAQSCIATATTKFTGKPVGEAVQFQAVKTYGDTAQGALG